MDNEWNTEKCFARNEVQKNITPLRVYDPHKATVYGQGMKKIQ